MCKCLCTRVRNRVFGELSPPHVGQGVCIKSFPTLKRVVFIFKLTLCPGLNIWEQNCRQEKGLLCEFVEDLLLLKMLQYFFALLCVWTVGGEAEMADRGNFASVQIEKNPFSPGAKITFKSC